MEILHILQMIRQPLGVIDAGPVFRRKAHPLSELYGGGYFTRRGLSYPLDCAELLSHIVGKG